MADDLQTVRSVNWRELLPFTHLFRAFRVAVHPSKLVLGLLLILTFYMGGRILDGIWPRAHKATLNEIEAYEDIRWAKGGRATLDPLTDIPAEQLSDFYERVGRTNQVAAPTVDPDRIRGVFDTFFTYEIHQIGQTIDSAVAMRWAGDLDAPTLLRNYRTASVAKAITNFLIIGPGWLISRHVIFFLLLTCIFLVVWAVFGGAIARIAAVHIARDEKISVRQALSFSASKVLSFVFAPVIPMGIIVGLGLVLAVGGLIFYLPHLGGIIVGIFFPLALVAGFVITLVALGTLGGFNLMYPTVAVEGSDSFDAISRSFSYVFARPWRMAFYTAVGLVYGGICYLFVRYFIYVMLSLTHYFMSWWLGGQPGHYFPEIWPNPDVSSLIYAVNWHALRWPEALSAGLICFWVYLAICMLGAFGISFYFSSNTIIYFLMRQDVDATELDDVYIEESEEDFGEAPPIAVAPSPVPEPPAAVVSEAPPPASPTIPPVQPDPPAL